MELIDFLLRIPLLDLVAISAALTESLVRAKKGSKPVWFWTISVCVLVLGSYQYHPLFFAEMDNVEAGYFLIFSSYRFAVSLVLLAIFAVFASLITRRVEGK